MKYKEFEGLVELKKEICRLVQELQLCHDKQMVVCYDNSDGADNYWLLSHEVTNDIHIPIATWHSESGLEKEDKEFNDWQGMVAWLFEEYTDGVITEMYNEYM